MNLPDRLPESLADADLVGVLLPAAVRILSNDFSLSGIDPDLNGFNGDVYALRDQLVPVVEQLGGPGSEKFHQLMYRVDIPEKRLNAVIEATSGIPVTAGICELLIIRALQKAWFRAKYS